MQASIAVGTYISLGNRRMQCVAIQTTKRECIAKVDSSAEAAIGDSRSSKYLDTRIDDFNIGDKIEYDFQVLHLEPIDAGDSISYNIYTYFKVRKL